MTLAAALKSVTDHIASTAVDLDAAIKARRLAQDALTSAQSIEAGARAAFDGAQYALHTLVSDIEDEGFDLVVEDHEPEPEPEAVVPVVVAPPVDVVAAPVVEPAPAPTPEITAPVEAPVVETVTFAPVAEPASVFPFVSKAVG